MNQTDLDRLLSTWRAAEPDGFLLTEREAAQVQDAARIALSPKDPDTADLFKAIDGLTPLADAVLNRPWFCLMTDDAGEITLHQFPAQRPQKVPEADAARCSSASEFKAQIGLQQDQKAMLELEFIMLVLAASKNVDLRALIISDTAQRWSYIKTGEILPPLLGLRQRRAKPPASKLAEHTSEISSLDGSVLTLLYNNASLTESAKPLLVAFLEVIASSGFNDRKVTLSIDSYMTQRGFKNRNTAVAQIRQDISVLYSMSVKYRTKGAQGEFRILDKREIDRHGNINVWFAQSFVDFCTAEMRAMPHMSYLQRLDQGSNPYSYALGFKLETHKWLNGGKLNEDIISVAALLEVAGFPTEEEVTNWHYDERIMEPFFRDMDALSPILSWELQHRGGKPLSDAERENMDYHLFKRLFVRVSWTSYPVEEQKKLQGKRRKKAEAGSDAPEKPKRGRPKKGNG